MGYKSWFNKHTLKHKNIVDKLLSKNYTKEQIIDYFEFDNMVKKENDFCPLYVDNKKCHDMKKLNCYLCACPNFRFNDSGIKQIDKNTQYSFCNIGSKEGRQGIYGDKIHQDCSNCTIPHAKSYVEKYFDLDWKKIMKDCTF
jgi:Zn-finger protein